MKRFSDILILRPGDNPAEAQKRARLRFPKEVAQSKLSLRRPAVPLSHSGTHFILGVATYSRPDLDLLDDIDSSLNGGTPHVEVFDVLDCQQMSDFEKFIPGLQSVYQTPVLGVIADGKLIDTASGLHKVEETLRKHHILNSQSVST